MNADAAHALLVREDDATVLDSEDLESNPLSVILRCHFRLGRCFQQDNSQLAARAKAFLLALEAKRDEIMGQASHRKRRQGYSKGREKGKKGLSEAAHHDMTALNNYISHLRSAFEAAAAAQEVQKIAASL